MVNKKLTLYLVRIAMHIVCLVLLIFFQSAANAGTTDSLRSLLKAHPQNDSTRVRLLSAVSIAYVNTNVDSAILFANEGLSIAKKTDFDEGISLALQALGQAYVNRNEYDKAIKYYNDALEITRKNGKNTGLSLIYCHLGDVYTRSSKHNEAMEYYKKSISLSMETGEVQVQGLSLMSMANLYTDLGSYAQALKYYLDALKIFESTHDEALPTCLSNIATVYSSLGDYKKALEYNKQGMEIFQKTGNKMGVLSTSVNVALVYGESGDYRSTISLLNKAVLLADSIGDKYFKIICLANIGESYYNLKSYDSAYRQYMLTLHEAEAVGDQASIAQCQNGMGSILVKQGKTKEGIKHLLAALEIMRQAGLKVSIQEITQNLSEAYEKEHDLTDALKYYKISATYNDSIYKEKNDKRIEQLQFDYELGKKEAQINLLQKDKIIAQSKSEKQSAIIWASLISLAFLVVISIVLYRSRAYEKRSKEEIFKQKEEIQAQAKKLTELNSFKDKTFSVLSHDLRGPIDSFHSIITMLDEEAISPEEYMKLKPEMNIQIGSLTILLDNLLKWASSYMKGQIAAKPTDSNINTIARQNISLLQNTASRKQITLNNAIPDETIAFCDPGQMDIVIRNLTMNAIKFTTPGGSITLAALSDDSKTYITIADNGVGMTDEQLGKLFTIAPDNHTYGTNGETGTGLGLLLCYEFVKGNNGTITVKSEKGKGSIFTITLPRSKRFKEQT